MKDSKNNNSLQKVFSIIDYRNMSYDFKDMMQYQEKQYLDQINRIESAREEKKQKATDQRNVEILSNLVKLEIPISQMELITGLSSEKINQYITDFKIC